MLNMNWKLEQREKEGKIIKTGYRSSKDHRGSKRSDRGRQVCSMRQR